MQIAIWSVAEGQPRRLETRRDFLEADLETWIRRHPELVMEGMTWVGQQVVLPPDRCRPDLIGVTVEGQLVVAELKQGPVNLATLVQGLHYVLAIAAMKPEDFLGRLDLDEQTHETLASTFSNEGGLDIALMLVGTGKAPELERAKEFLAERGLDVPLRIVSFFPFADESGRVFLAREIEEHEQSDEELSVRRRSSRAASVERIRERAHETGTGAVIESAIHIANSTGLKVKPWPKSITIVPPFGPGHTLLYLSPMPDATVHVGYSLENYTSLYNADPNIVSEAFGENWTNRTPDQAAEMLESFKALMERLQGGSSSE